MEASEHGANGIDQIAAALAKAQGEMEPARKTSENPHFHSKYADLAAVFEACKPLARHGIAVSQDISTALSSDNKLLLVSCRTELLHASGQRLASSTMFPVELSKCTIQTMGSIETYLKRRGLSARAGICADDDDDGNAAAGLNGGPGRTQQAQPAHPETARVMSAMSAAGMDPVVTKPQGEPERDTGKPDKTLTVVQSGGKGQPKSDVRIDSTDCRTSTLEWWRDRIVADLNKDPDGKFASFSRKKLANIQAELNKRSAR